MDLNETGKNLARLRRGRGWAQEKLGEKLGVTGKTVSRWETGSYLPPVEVLLELSRLYGVPMESLLSGRVAVPDQPVQSEEPQPPRPNAFPLEERVAFFKKKWKRDHRASLVLTALLAAAVLGAGLWTKIFWLFPLGTLIALAGYLRRRNEMMIYVEANAFDGSGT